MARPREYQDERTTTALRIPPDLHADVKAAASERGLSANRLMLAAIEDFMRRLIPIEEFSYVRPQIGAGEGTADREASAAPTAKQTGRGRERPT